MDPTLEDLSQAIQNVGVGDYFPQLLSEDYLAELHSAALYLSAAVMDCLTTLIEFITQSGFAPSFP